MPLGSLDKDGRDFRYVQIAAQIRELIDSGEYPPGRLLPSEQHLMQHYGVARGTVRTAIALLREEGYVDVLQHRGTFVTDDPPRPGAGGPS